MVAGSLGALSQSSNAIKDISRLRCRLTRIFSRARERNLEMEAEDTFLYIPVASTDEVVAVPIEELPEEAEDLLDILKAEEAPLSLWIDFAKAYLAQVSTSVALQHVLTG